MDKKYDEMHRLSTDIFNISTILLKYSKASDDEETLRLRTIFEILYKKSDDLCYKFEDWDNEDLPAL